MGSCAAYNHAIYAACCHGLVQSATFGPTCRYGLPWILLLPISMTVVYMHTVIVLKHQISSIVLWWVPACLCLLDGQACSSRRHYLALFLGFLPFKAGRQLA